MMGLPAYGMRAYALFYSRHGSSEAFGQSELDWIVSEPMKKKIFALLLKSGWIKKIMRGQYKCVSPEKAVKGLLKFRAPGVLKCAGMPYALTGLSAIEVWSDYSYVQRGLEKSPYFLKVLEKDLKAWREFLNAESMPNYVEKGGTIGEFVVLKPVKKLEAVERHGLMVEPLKEALKTAEGNYLHSYALDYMKEHYGVV